MTRPFEHLADGTHEGIRWHLMCDDGGPFLTLSGFVGSAYLFDQVEAAGVTALSVPGIVEAEIAAVRRRSARQTAREAVF